MGWDRLVASAAVVVAGLLLATGLAKGDTESLVLGAGFAAAAAVSLTVPRLRTPAHVGLGLLFLNVLFWMATAAVANLSSGEGVGDVAVPVVLSVSSVVGAASVVLGLVDRRRPIAGARVVAIAGIAAAGVAVVASQVVGGATDAVRPGDIAVDTEDAVFEPERLEVRAGDITIVTKNRDLFWHTFTIDELDVDVRVPVGARRRRTFTVEPGTYEYYCAIPGHRAIGMEGVLVVH